MNKKILIISTYLIFITTSILFCVLYFTKPPGKMSNEIAIKNNLQNYYNLMKRYYPVELELLGDRITGDLIPDNVANDAKVSFVSYNGDIFKYKVNFTFISYKYKKYVPSLMLLYNINTDVFGFEKYKSYTIDGKYKGLDSFNTLNTFRYFDTHSSDVSIIDKQYQYPNLLAFCKICSNVKTLVYNPKTEEPPIAYFNQDPKYIKLLLNKFTSIILGDTTEADLIYQYNGMDYINFNLDWHLMSEDSDQGLAIEEYKGIVLFNPKSGLIIFPDIFWNNPTD